MQTKRHIYLKKKTREEALDIFLAALPDYSEWPEEEMPVKDALGRVTSRQVQAVFFSPTANVSAMDGLAVNSADTFGASETSPIRLKIGEQARFVNTGETVPDGFDAVIMIEDIHQPDEFTIEIMAAVPPWNHVRPIGEDIVVDEQILPSGHMISPPDIGALLSGGLTKVWTRKMPVVGIIPTGDEVIEPGQIPEPGQVVESNSAVLAAFLKEWGAEAIRYPIVKDAPDLILAKAARAIEKSDLLLIIAGSSAGDRDHTADVIAQMGRVLVHGVSIMPGKPVILGIVDKKPVIGLPGYPVSGIIAFDLFVRPVISRMLRRLFPKPDSVKARIARKLPSKLGQEEYIRVKLGNLGGKYIAATLARGSGVITSLTRADAMLKVPMQSEGLDAGSEVEVYLLKSRQEIDRSIIFIGSHDPSLDLLADYLARKEMGLTLSITHLGSLGGLMALKRGECHLTGIHLLDPETGRYNIPYIQKYLPGKKVHLINLAFRDQGLIVKSGNPKNIKGLEDLVRQDIRFVNRQSGAGTRLLLDHWLVRMGIGNSLIKDYRREVFTHMAVAALVKSGGADCGLGILSAARSLGLEFLPLAKEQYDLLVPEEYFDLSGIERLLDILGDKGFKRDLESMGGYDCSNTGEVQCLN
ncbi:molybdopterin biosynthesis protein [bacterium]|nr:molybdopterin biosynthesis protein [bacterium]